MAKAYKKLKRGGAKFAKLDHSLMDAMTTAKLSIGARWVMVELIRRYTGVNNGKIYLPTREAAHCMGTHRHTVGKYYQELKAAGFIVETQMHHLGVDGLGRATEWRLTHLPCDGKAPTRDFEKTKPLSKKLTTPVENTAQGRHDTK